MPTDREQIHGLQVATELADFVNHELLPRLDRDEDTFWRDFASIIADLSPRNTKLLAVRDRLQAGIDTWHRQHRNQAFDPAEYEAFLRDIGYLLESGEDFQVTTTDVDTEITRQAGPQLVVPIKNARFALNAANARWGSLYDALYGTDAIPETDGSQTGEGYNPVRGQRVIDYARSFLDQACPLAEGSYSDITGFVVEAGKLLVALEPDATSLAKPDRFRGYRGDPANPSAILLCQHGLHIEIQLDRNSRIGRQDRAGIKDMLLEAALTTIQDCEDSVTAVDAEDKVEVYRNWLGLIYGDLTETFDKQGEPLTRILNLDREYLSPNGQKHVLPGLSLLLIRNVGHLMRNDAILDAAGEPVYEGIMDAMITCSIASLDVLGKTLLKNSRTGSIYVVKPKMHGPDEVSFACLLVYKMNSKG